MVIYSVFIRNLDAVDLGLLILFASSEVTDISLLEGKEVYGSVTLDAY